MKSRGKIDQNTGRIAKYIVVADFGRSASKLRPGLRSADFSFAINRAKLVEEKWDFMCDRASDSEANPAYAS